MADWRKTPPSVLFLFVIHSLLVTSHLTLNSHSPLSSTIARRINPWTKSFPSTLIDFYGSNWWTTRYLLLIWHDPLILVSAQLKSARFSRLITQWPGSWFERSSGTRVRTFVHSKTLVMHYSSTSFFICLAVDSTRNLWQDIEFLSFSDAPWNMDAFITDTLLS